jgi:signal transduction histidine kinase
MQFSLMLSVATSETRSDRARTGGGRLRLWPAASSRPFLTPLAAMILAVSLTALFAAIDFVVPGEVNVAILYGLCVGVCAWSRSPRFLWAIAAASAILTFAGLFFGPAPITGRNVLHLFWIDRAFVAVKLLILAVFVHLWMRRSEWLRATSTLLRERADTLSENLRQSQKMEAIGQLTEGIAHDFKNILTVIIGNLEMIATDRGDEAKRQRLARAVLQSAESATGLVQRLLAFSRPLNPAPEAVHADAITRRMLPLWEHSLGGRVELVAELPDALWPCRLDPAQFEAAVLNLVVNAKDAMPNGGRITIRAENAKIGPDEIAGLSPGDYVLVSVNDNGPGIPADFLPKAFHPFFTTKAAGKGSGLGLWMVSSFANQSGGALRLESEVGTGTTVRLYLPSAAGGECGNSVGDELGAAERSGKR